MANQAAAPPASARRWTCPARRSPSGATRSGCRSASSRRTGCCSQFMHGEQGALICTAKIVETVPWIDAKYYAATQVMDEARHVEVFAKYLDTKLVGPLPAQRPPRPAARRHHRGQPLGHDLPRHADHGRGPRPRRLRLHAPDDHRAAAQEAAPLRHVRRGPPRRLRRALAQGVLRRAVRRRDARAPGVRLRGRRAHARPLPPAGGLGPHGPRRQGGPAARDAGARARDVPVDAVRQDRAQLQEAGPARPQRRLAAHRSSPSSASSSSRTGPTPRRSSRSSSSPRARR